MDGKKATKTQLLETDRSKLQERLRCCRVGKLKSLEEGSLLTVGTFYPTTAFREFRLGRQQPKTVILPAYVNFGMGKMDFAFWALQNPMWHRTFSPLVGCVIVLRRRVWSCEAAC
jgi:hypothetical protein